MELPTGDCQLTDNPVKSYHFVRNLRYWIICLEHLGVEMVAT